MSSTAHDMTEINEFVRLAGLPISDTATMGAPYVRDENNTVNRLAALPPIEYDKVREEEAKALGTRVSTLDKEVEAERKLLEQDGSDQNSIVSDVDEWPEVIQGGQLLSELESIYRQYTILPDGAAVALSLWTLGTYCFDAFRIYPMINLSSPEKRCGKSTVMALLKALTNKSLLASNISPAAIYRITELCRPTLLIDEADTFLKDNDELRGVVNSGHSKDTAFVIKCDGDQNVPKKFSTWTPKALAMIGELPDTLKDRSIVVSMRRKLPGETILKIPLNASDQFMDVRRKCKRWAADNFEQLTKHVPTMPSRSNDREIDNWTPLFTIAGVCGWEQVALDSMLSISPKDEDDSIKVVLLNDIKDIFDNRSVDSMYSEDLVNALVELNDRPWAEWRRGKQLTTNSLARLLKPFKIRPKQIKRHTTNKNGYEFSAFKETFKRYLPPPPDPTSTTLPASAGNSFSDIQTSTVTKEAGVEKQPEPAPVKGSRGVEVENRDMGGKEDIHRNEVSI